MSTATELVLDEVEKVVAAVTGIRQAQSSPNETQNTGLWAVIYVPKARIKIGPTGTRRNLDAICIDICKTRTWLPNDMDALVPLIDLVGYALVAEVSPGGDLFNRTIQTFDGVDVILLPKVEYAEVTCIGYRFTMTGVKTLIDL